MRAFLLFSCIASTAYAFTPVSPYPHRIPAATAGFADTASSPRLSSTALAAAEEWQGDVVKGGKILGCSLQQVAGSMTEWTITIDGVEADLGRFSGVVYKKLLMNAKEQRFQGFRPGTLPPHLEPTYRTFAMDECARETVLEALQQNNIRPFENARSEIHLYRFSIPPSASKKKKSSKKRKTKDAEATLQEAVEEEPPAWRTFETMKEAIDAGWKPGQSFSFLARDIKGQQLKDEKETAGSSPIGLNF